MQVWSSDHDFTFNAGMYGVLGYEKKRSTWSDRLSRPARSDARALKPSALSQVLVTASGCPGAQLYSSVDGGGTGLGCGGGGGGLGPGGGGVGAMTPTPRQSDGVSGCTKDPAERSKVKSQDL